MLHVQYILCSKPVFFTALGLQHVPRYTKQWKSIQTVVVQRKHNNDYIKYAIIAARAAIIIIIALICHWALILNQICNYARRLDAAGAGVQGSRWWCSTWDWEVPAAIIASTVVIMTSIVLNLQFLHHILQLLHWMCDDCIKCSKYHSYWFNLIGVE